MSGYVERLNAAWLDHLAPRATDAPTVVSTFAGCGGSSLGYSMAGFRELLAVEWDDNAVATFRANFPEVPVYHGDIAALSVDECLSLTGLRPGELDVLDGSPPCQGFSTAGKRNLDDSRNQLFREYVRLLRGLRPNVFVMENVSGMVKGKMKLVFAEIMRELKASGYVVSARLMNAMYFDVPQSRERMIFVGVRDDLEMIPSHPKALTKPVTIREALPWVIANEITGRIGSQFRRVDVCTSKPMPTIQHSDPEQTRYEVSRKPIIRFVTGFSKGETISIDRVSPIVMKDGYAGSGHSQYVIDDGQTTRKFEIAEVKRLCSFPEVFEMIGSYNQQWSRLGNSVPPLFMRAIAEHIRANLLTAATVDAMAAD